jgi:two-component system alkaline phosphatase synthesis response regulator PhoP
MSKARVLIIEDEEDIVELIKYNLVKAGYEVAQALTGEKGLEAVKVKTPDLILLDLMLPGVGGLEVCKLLRSNSQTAQTPIIMVSAKGAEADVVTGLELGADDYISKPFSPKILLARIEAVLRRRSGVTPVVAPSDSFEIHGVYIHPGKCEVRIEGNKVDLSRTEFQVLSLLARKRGWVFTRSKIVEEVQGPNYPVTDRAVDVQIVGLRKKLGNHGDLIETVRGVGYRFKE